MTKPPEGDAKSAAHLRSTQEVATSVRVVTLCVLMIAAVLLWAFSEWSATTVHQVAFSSLSLTAVAWGGAILITDPEQPYRSLLRLGPLMLTAGGVTFGLASVTAWLAPQTVLQLQIETFHSAHALVILGFAGFALGYLFTPRAGLHRSLDGALSRLHQWGERRGVSSSSALMTYSLGLSALVLSAVLSGSYGYLGGSFVTSANDVSWYNQLLNILSSLRGFAIVAFWVTALQRSTPHRLLLAVTITGVDLTAGLLSGMKEAPTVTLIAVGLAYIHVKRRVPVVALATVAAWFVLFLSPLVAALRAVVRGDGALTLEEALPAMMSGLSQAGAGSGGDLWVVLARFRLIDNVAIINLKTPSEIAFQPVWDLAAVALSGFVPRAVWPSKPVQLDGLIFYQQYYGGTTYTSGALTMPGSLYMHGGVIVLALGMILLGMLTRSLDDAMRAHASRTGLMLLLALFPPFIKMEMSVPTLLASLPSIAIGWLLASWLLYHPKRSDTKQGLPGPRMRGPAGRPTRILA